MVVIGAATGYNPHPMSSPSSVVTEAPPSDAPLPWALIGAACLGSFAATASGTTRAPLLIDMARDLSVSIPLVANLVTATSIAWGITSFLSGIASDRWGRRPCLIGGTLALTLAMLGVALAGQFWSVAAWATMAGACSGVFMGAVFAEVSSRVPDQQRGRALGWVMSGQSLTLVVGVPAAAWLGASIGWRGFNVCVGALAFLAAISLWFTTTRPAKGAVRIGGPVSLRQAMTTPVVMLLTMGIAERICHGLVVVYFATYLQQAYDLKLAAVGLPLLIMAIGNLVGTALGGQLADKVRDRLGTFGFSLIGTGIAGVALFAWQPGLIATVAMAFAYVFVNALGRPAFMAALADVPDDVRGTVMGLNGTCASVGWAGAAGLGGWMMATQGFGGFGPLAAALAAAGAALAFLRRGAARRKAA